MSLNAIAAPVPATSRHLSRRGRLAASALSDKLPCALVTWYLGLIPHWTSGGPRLRTRLLLRTHQWIVERIVAPEASLAAAAADLCPDGQLTRILTDMVPAEDAEHRGQFIRVLVANLRHALLRPVTQRNEAWVRWLFLIPYSVKGWDTPAAGGASSAGRLDLRASRGSGHEKGTTRGSRADGPGAVTGREAVDETSG
jgi:hypothetical protein